MTDEKQFLLEQLATRKPHMLPSEAELREKLMEAIKKLAPLGEIEKGAALTKDMIEGHAADYAKKVLARMEEWIAKRLDAAIVVVANDIVRLAQLQNVPGVEPLGQAHSAIARREHLEQQQREPGRVKPVLAALQAALQVLYDCPSGLAPGQEAELQVGRFRRNG